MRLQDWQERFAEFGRVHPSMPFAWGCNDCCTFAAAAVEAITGANPMALVEPYDSEIGALRRIAEAGGLSALASAYLGEPVEPVMAAVGDIVLVVNAGREMLGVCNGTSVLAPGEKHIEVLHMDAAFAAWKI